MPHHALNVWLNGQLVGQWAWTRTDTHSFHYAQSWLDSPLARPLSLSLPIPAGQPELRGPQVRNYFDNLLPDSDAIRQRLRTRFRLDSGKVQDLLTALGRDCVGAVQLLPEGQEPTGYDTIQGAPLTEAQIEQHLHSVTSTHSFTQDANEDDFRISIAGAQEKTALLWHQGQWCHPRGATPSTHIFKLPLGLVGNMQADMSGSIENEWLCLRIMEALGFTVAQAHIATFGTQKVLVVERFDRRLINKGQWIARLPQEDFCQATGTAPAHKYESDGGPGIAQCLSILGGSTQAAQDKLNFALANLAFWLLAATDGHAKNYSIALLPGAQYQLTPLYDILSAWPVIGEGANQVPRHRAKLAMALRSKNAHSKLVDIQTRHWQSLASQTGVPHAFSAMVEMVERVGLALAQVEQQLPPHFPQHIWGSIKNGMLNHQQRFLQGLSATTNT